jgi:hypothetical protein
MHRGTEVDGAILWTHQQYPSKGSTVILKGLSYTIINVEFNLDEDSVTITGMLTENVDGSGVEDL